MDSTLGSAMSASGRLWATCLGIIAMAMMACTSEPEATPTPSATAERVATVTSETPVPTSVPTVASDTPMPTGVATAASDTPVPTSGSLPNLRADFVFPSVSFDRMVYLTHPEGMPDRLYLVLQPGRIMAFDNVESPPSPDTFLDIRRRVSDRGNEEGLLGLAFDPAYRNNGYFYVYYSAASPRRSVIARYQASPDGNSADPSTEKIVMQVGQPFSNHNGGHITFGPDGYLYVGLGDGGSGGDPRGHGQNLGTLLGAILRIDVSTLDVTGSYAVPPDNPFVGVEGARPEIWAYGLRNPWRFSFDRETGELWAGDVGQNKLEEIDIITPGGNYGWNIMEGSSCFRDNRCDRDEFVPPVAEYGRDGGCSVTGGYVYRGSRLPALVGAYLYGDFCTGKIWALRYDGSRVTENAQIADTDLQISSFAEGPDGEVYILSFTGQIARLTLR